MPTRPHMKKVRAKNTSPEIKLRKLLCEWGYRGYRLYRSDLPGNPDVAFIARQKAIFMHGCFWHGHNCRAGKNVPQSNLDYWKPKLERNKKRDQDNIQKLKEINWDVLIIWECQLKDVKSVKVAVDRFLCASSI